MAEEEKKEETKVEADESEVKPDSEAATPQDSGDEAKAETPAEEEKQDKSEDKPAEPDWKALYALTLADFDNYKKRAARDREDTYR